MMWLPFSLCACHIVMLCCLSLDTSWCDLSQMFNHQIGTNGETGGCLKAMYPFVVA